MLLKQEKSAIISVRIDEHIKLALESESENNGISVNSLISQILYKYTKWDTYIKDIGFGAFPKEFVKKLLEDMDDKAIPEFAVQSSKSSLKNAMIFMNGDITIESLGFTLNSWLDAINIQYKESTLDGN